ncbi:MAG: SUMF1/EgtB/PvdO family nonheme iron enzyme [Spirochaetaceae bacterium]|jgi:hypothetical protein|nr:SUMF1/EgtB/PvdO family nonheme iron enzyme [Spirochaetaceae bacterium]
MAKKNKTYGKKTGARDVRQAVEKSDFSANADSDVVRLRPFLGLEPGKYLAILYGAILVAVVFFAFFFPGITGRAAPYTITSEPSGAAVRLDDVYQGRTPCNLIIPQGRHTVTVALSGFDEAHVEEETPARLFIKPPFARPINLNIAMKESTPLSALIRGAREYAEWSFTGEPTAVYRLPYSLSAGARFSASRPEWDTAAQDGAQAVLLSAARFTSSRFGLKDLLRAQFYVHNGGAAPTPAGLLGAIGSIYHFIDATPAFNVLLADILPDSQAAAVLESGVYPKETIDFSDEDRILREKAVFGGIVAVEGVRFRAISGANFTQTASFPHKVNIDPFYIALEELSVENWDLFTAENPEWRIENAGALTAKRLVTDGYLSGSTDPAYPQPTVSGISAHAADAYCTWLTEKLPPSLAGYEVRLPTEAEWEFAAKTVIDSEGAPNLPRAMIATASSGAGLWEWCADDFVPQNYFTVPAEAAQAVPSPERNVRGGCWVNPAFLINAETRASLPPDFCSPFVSARPVIVKKGG